MEDTVKYVASKWLGRHSQVAKATVCKTVIPRFKSGCRLHLHFLRSGFANDVERRPKLSSIRSPWFRLL